MRRPPALAAATALVALPLLVACTDGTSAPPPGVTSTPTASAPAPSVTPPLSTPTSAGTTATAPTTTLPAPTDTAPNVPGGASPQITYAGPGAASGTYDISGIVLGVVEAGGQCTFTLTPEHGQSVVARSSSISDATSTSCGTVTVPADTLTAGTWHVTLTYVGGKQGTSDPVPLAVG